MPIHAPRRASVVRRLFPSERDLFSGHLQRLDPTSRRLRFGRAVDDSFLLHYAEACFGLGDLVFGAFVEGAMRGAAELRSSGVIAIERAPPDANGAAESAFSVEPEWRRRGLGRALLRRVLRAARNHGVATIELFCAPENAAVMNLAREVSHRVDVEPDQAA